MAAVATTTPNDCPPHLAIRIIYSDEDIVVVDKPCNLRSVPGHANPPPESRRRANKGDRLTAQEAWAKALSLAAQEAIGLRGLGEREIQVSLEESAGDELIINLGATSNPSCVPRKFETFVKYCRRNSKRLLPSLPYLHDGNQVKCKKEEKLGSNLKKQKLDHTRSRSAKDSLSLLMRNIALESYTKIQRKQGPLMNLPEPTKDWESVIGQLSLLGFGGYNHIVTKGANPSNLNGICVKGTVRQSGEYRLCPGASRLHVVHRLDCQTSGIMVVARNQDTASYLCQAWRERDSVQKIYLAHVRCWPPYHQHRDSGGIIDVPLAPSRLERIKWEVRPVSEGGKECKTIWRVHENLDETGPNEEDEATQFSPIEKKGIILELRPITGRTHQLRIHCATIGSGIVGDSLYGDQPIGNGTEATDKPGSQNSLRLHAHRLTIPNPKSGKEVTFESPKPW